MERGGLRSCALALVAVISLISCQPGQSNQEPIDLPPDLEGIDYLHLIDTNSEILKDTDAADLQEILDLGRRNLNWLVVINQSRRPDQQLSFTSKDRSLAYPIDKPNVYNKDLVLDRFAELKAQIPAALRAVLNSNVPLPRQSALTDEEYTAWGYKIDVVYQSAVRWLTMKPYLPALVQKRKNDIRGFYHLNRDPNLGEKLARWQSLPPDVKGSYREWLIGVCANTESRKVCQVELKTLEASGADMSEFWLRYSPRSQAIWNSFFRIAWQRNDITWTSEDPSLATMPVLEPENEAVGFVLKQNVEDEWKWSTDRGPWHLSLNFEKGGSPAAMAHIEFVSGTTPHVIPPNKIVMNADQPATEYVYRWALRHEYGHILGFPDCYLEFYDEDQQAIVNYQLDTSDLMCSRRGVFKQNHFDEMKRVYFKEGP